MILRALPDRNYENILKAYKELQKRENKLNIRIYEQCLLPNIDESYRIYRYKDMEPPWGDSSFKNRTTEIINRWFFRNRTAASMKPYSDDP